MTKVLTVIGTRPEAIKLAPVLHELERHPESFSSVVVTTGQHREMLQPMFELFRIDPDYDLGVMRDGHSLNHITRSVITGLESILTDEAPDCVLVQGDTTTTMAASLAAFHARTHLAHVEAGLRTFDKHAPYPEEINRRIASVLADVHFAPTPWARGNLLREGVPPERIHVTGNTVIDALRHVADLDIELGGTALEDLPEDKRLILVTTHRRENFGPTMESIASGIRELALSRDDVHFIYPMHLNPQAREPVRLRLSGIDNVSLVEPLEYQHTVWLLRRADLVITDSGGLQEEAAAVNTPVLVLRDTTERPEGVEAGIAHLVAPNHQSIVAATKALLDDPAEWTRMRTVACPYGDGQAARRIARVLAGPHLQLVDDSYERPAPAHPLDQFLTEATVDRRRHGRRASDHAGRWNADRAEAARGNARRAIARRG